MVTATGTGVVKTNEPKIWKEFLQNFKESLELTKGWARSVLRNMNWQKRKENTGQVEPCAKTLEIEHFSFQRAIFLICFRA